MSEVRNFFAKLMFAASSSNDLRLETALRAVHREAFLPPGPWLIRQVTYYDQYIETPSADPIYVQQNVLVALDAAKGINNGEPYLHARWLGAVAPQPGETVTHIGVGLGYYTALLATLVMPGKVEGFEIDQNLAAQARSNLQDFANVAVTPGDATTIALPPSDVIYVNAGVTSPPLAWIESLRQGGRLIFPWRPSDAVGLALIVTRRAAGLAVKPLMSSWFIPCIGASDTNGCAKTPNPKEARATRSVWATSARAPDDTATAVYADLWFSFERVEGE